MIQTRMTEFGLEAFCPKCGEWWPANTVFFPKSPKGGVKTPCHACTDEQRKAMAAVTPCCVPGCNKPRYHWRFSRCWDHRQYLKVNPNARSVPSRGKRYPEHVNAPRRAVR